MSQKAKLIWKFSGPDALQTAEHHLIHLKEFSEMESVPFIGQGTEQNTTLSFNAFIVVDMKWVELLREKLKPTEGYLVE